MTRIRVWHYLALVVHERWGGPTWLTRVSSDRFNCRSMMSGTVQWHIWSDMLIEQTINRFQSNRSDWLIRSGFNNTGWVWQIIFQLATATSLLPTKILSKSNPFYSWEYWTVTTDQVPFFSFALAFTTFFSFFFFDALALPLERHQNWNLISFSLHVLFSPLIH